MAVGTSNRLVKYWELSDFELISSTILDNDFPKRVVFDKQGRYAYLGFNECIKVYNLDEQRPPLLDVIP